VLEDVAAKTPGVVLVKLNVDANRQTSMRFGIRGIPAVKAFRDGRVVDEFIGLQPRQFVERFFSRLTPAVPETLPDEVDALRAYVQAHADSVEARRHLGRKLLAAGAWDEADAVLAAGDHDAVSDGLRARIELLRESPGLLPASLASPDGVDELAVMPELIAALRSSDRMAKSKLRRVAVGMLAGADHNPAVEAFRAQLANALF
jgi:putative thioredoxin